MSKSIKTAALALAVVASTTALATSGNAAPLGRHASTAAQHQVQQQTPALFDQAKGNFE